MKFEKLEGINEMPEEMTEFRDMYPEVLKAMREGELGLHELKLQELSESLADKDEEFKTILEMEKRAFEIPTGAIVSAFEIYATDRGIKLKQGPINVDLKMKKPEIEKPNE